MHRDPRDVWPDDVPIGTFDLDEAIIAGYPGATGHLLFVCPGNKRCGVLVGPQPVARLYVWGWDGNLEHPTLTPSINCLAEKEGRITGGCGWHGHIQNGEFC